MKLQSKMLGKLQSETLGFHNAKVKPSEEISISWVRMLKEVGRVGREVKDWKGREVDGPSWSPLYSPSMMAGCGGRGEGEGKGRKH